MRLAPVLSDLTRWAARLGVVACVVVHVLSLAAVSRDLDGAALALFAGLGVLVPVSMGRWAAYARRNGVGVWDKAAQNRLAADVFDALPRRQERTLWAALAYGLAWFVLVLAVDAPLSGAFSAIFAFFYLLIALVPPRPPARVGRSIPRRRRSPSPGHGGRGRLESSPTS